MSLPVWSSLLLATTLAAGDKPPADPLREQREAAIAMLDAMQKGDYATAGKRFDATLQKVFTPEKIEATWKAIAGRYGPFKKRTGVRVEAGPKNDLVFLTCEFAKETRDFKIAFDKEKHIAGILLVPVRSAEFTDAPYVNRDAYREEAVVVGKDGDWPLPGTLTLPKGEGPFPAVVLVHGSGPLDRDETIEPNKPFRDLARGLASQGVAVLRYEKRTKEHGAKFIAQKAYSLKEETIDDVRSAVALLRAHKAVDPKRIVVVGHSLGAMAAPRIGEQEPGLAGIILLAGNSRPLEDLILEQFTYIYSLKGELSADDRKELEKIKKQVARVKDPALSADTPVAELPLDVPGEYWLYLRAYDPVATAAKLKMPVFVLQGERDYQVTADDFAGWKKGLAAKGNAGFKSYPALNHLFMEGKGKARPEEYEKPGHVAKEVVDDIAARVKAW
jgi:dienelactone hydrolase